MVKVKNYPDSKEYPYIAGLTNAKEEYTTPVQCGIQGTWPLWLQGVLYRVGPGIFDVETQPDQFFSFDHWFDGLSLLHRFEMKDGKVFYRSRFTSKAVEEQIIKDGGIGNTFTFGQDLCQSTFQRFISMFIPPRGLGDGTNADSANVNVTITPNLQVAGEKHIMIKTDASILQSIDEVTLEPKKLFTYRDFDNKLVGIGAAAHEEFDPETGDYFNFTMDFGATGTYHVFTVEGSSGKTRELCKFSAPACYAHSFASTKNYVIMIIWPYLFKAYGMSVLYYKNYVDSLSFDSTQTVKFHVIDRKTGQMVRVYEHEAFYVFHTVNAYEDEQGDILIDASAYDNANVVQELSLKHLRSCSLKFSPSSLRRWRLPLSTQASLGQRNGTALQEFKVETRIELPRTNDKVHQKKYRFVYGVSQSDECKVPFDSIVKIDVETKEVKRFHKANCVPGEAIFVAQPNGKDEDDGILMSVMLDGRQNASYLVIIDAKTMKEIANAQAPAVIPFGFHGCFMGSSV